MSAVCLKNFLNAFNELTSVLELVDDLQGRGKDITHGSYFVENPLKLKKM